MEDILKQITLCVEMGKVNKAAPFPPTMKGEDGADELTKAALEQGIKADTILQDALVKGMDIVGKKFSEKKIFIPQMLMSAKAMNAAVEHLKPYFQSGEIKRKGKFVIATVKGDLHDIGKNLVKMSVEGAGYEVIDLGVDVPADKVLEALKEHPGASLGLSALLTTTMKSMADIVAAVKAEIPETIITVGGAPVNDEFANEIGADNYAPDPQGVVEFLNK